MSRSGRAGHGQASRIDEIHEELEEKLTYAFEAVRELKDTLAVALLAVQTLKRAERFGDTRPFYSHGDARAVRHARAPTITAFGTVTPLGLCVEAAA